MQNSVLQSNNKKFIQFYFTSERIKFMMFKSRFFYDDGAAEGGGSTEQQEVIVDDKASTQPAAETTTVQSSTLPEDIAAELAELRAFKQANFKEAEKDPEVLAKEQEQDKANFIKYGVENNLFKIDELTQYESIKVKADADLVFENFLKDFAEENPDIDDEEELAEAAKDEFDNIYKISSSNEKAKEKGLAKLAKEANEIRSPYESKVKYAEETYTEEKQMRAKMPEFDKFLVTQINKNAPDKVTFSIKKGEEDFPVEIELTKEDKEAIVKEFKTPKTFLKFNESAEETALSLDKKIQGWIKVNKFEEALSKAAEQFEGFGVRKGSNVGADSPFAMRGGNVRPVSTGVTLEQSNEKIARARAQYN